jgi:hypothetical protein
MCSSCGAPIHTGLFSGCGFVPERDGEPSTASVVEIEFVTGRRDCKTQISSTIAAREIWAIESFRDAAKRSAQPQAHFSLALGELSALEVQVVM